MRSGTRGGGAAAGRRLTESEFLAVLAERRPGWDRDAEGRLLVLPLAERDLAWVLECLAEHAEGEYHVLADGSAVVLRRAQDLAFLRVACL
jgi:hypothetical protein